MEIRPSIAVIASSIDWCWYGLYFTLHASRTLSMTGQTLHSLSHSGSDQLVISDLEKPIPSNSVSNRGVVKVRVFLPVVSQR